MRATPLPARHRDSCNPPTGLPPPSTHDPPTPSSRAGPGLHHHSRGPPGVSRPAARWPDDIHVDSTADSCRQMGVHDGHSVRFPFRGSSPARSSLHLVDRPDRPHLGALGRPVWGNVPELRRKHVCPSWEGQTRPGLPPVGRLDSCRCQVTMCSY